MADSSNRIQRGFKPLYGVQQHSNKDDGPASSRSVTRAPNTESKNHGIEKGGETGKPTPVTGR